MTWRKLTSCNLKPNFARKSYEILLPEILLEEDKWARLSWLDIWTRFSLCLGDFRFVSLTLETFTWKTSLGKCAAIWCFLRQTNLNSSVPPSQPPRVQPVGVQRNPWNYEEKGCRYEYIKGEENSLLKSVGNSGIKYFFEHEWVVFWEEKISDRPKKVTCKNTQGDSVVHNN